MLDPCLPAAGPGHNNSVCRCERPDRAFDEVNGTSDGGRLGATALTASNGKEALAILREEPGISLVFLDLAMPELSGLEVLRLIREFRRTLPVYLMTGFLPESTDTSRATGVLTKPVELTRMRDLLAAPTEAAS